MTLSITEQASAAEHTIDRIYGLHLSSDEEESSDEAD